MPNSTQDQEPEEPKLSSKDYAERLNSIRALSVNPIYQELLGYLRAQKTSIEENKFVIPTTVAGILSRERFFGVAEEYDVLLAWLSNQEADAQESFERLKLEEQQAKETQS